MKFRSVMFYVVGPLFVLLLVGSSIFLVSFNLLAHKWAMLLFSLIISFTNLRTAVQIMDQIKQGPPENRPKEKSDGQ